MNWSFILQQNLEALPYLYAELVLVATFISILVADLIWLNHSFRHFITYTLAATGLLLSGSLLMAQLPEATSPVVLFSDFILLGGKKDLYFRLLGIGSLLLTVVLRWSSEPPRSGEAGKTGETEYLLLLFGMLIGLQFLVVSHHLIMTLVALEMVSLCAYLLTIFRFSKWGSAAALNYMLFGAASAAIMAYGISWMYGSYGSLSYDAFSQAGKFSTGLNTLAVCLVSAGFLFKIAAFPFHFWVAETYQQAPTSFVAFLSTLPKVIGVFAFTAFLQQVAPVSLVHPTFSWWLVGTVAIGSMLVGNLAAIGQASVKKMLAFSSVAQAGFLLLAFSFATETDSSGLNALFYYGAVYTLLNLAAFQLAEAGTFLGGATTFTAFGGAAKANPLWAVCALLIMIGLTGLPPTAGFMAKLFIFAEIWRNYQVSAEVFFLVVLVVAVLNAALSLYYYLRIPYQVYFKKQAPLPAALPIRHTLFTMVMAFLSVLLFFFPEWLSF